MLKPEIRKLTNEELAGAGIVSSSKNADDFSFAKNSTKDAKLLKDLYSNEYIKALKISDVVKFFEPFGVMSCAKIPRTPNKVRSAEVEDPAFIFVICQDFNATFSDYNAVFDFGTSLYAPDESEKVFDMEAFAKYCDTINVTPESALKEMMAIDLFGKRFPSYGENYRAVKQKEAELALQNLPKSMQKKVAPVAEKTELMIDSTANKLKYGNYDALKRYFGQN